MKKFIEWVKSLFKKEVKAETKKSKSKLLKCECGSTKIIPRVSGVNICGDCGKIVKG